MDKLKILQVEVELVQGDITQQDDIDVIVNAANAQLETGGGVAGAIHRAAGHGLAEECRPMAPIKPGEAVISSGHQLPNPFVIHCLGPVYGVDQPSDALLADCYRNALLLADEHKLASIAFPSISTGAFGYPIKPAAGIALDTIKAIVPSLKNIQKIRIVLFDQTDFETFDKKLGQLNI
ncbi:macro domain-containing protein [Cyclobacterium jeungdonense]|uniref:Macro domain-containing protein n=1 Tax=Cyclobacterium jeungdonense TaxID=708087 RepID=A0ABT8C3V5_9BACT|nr:macro domain-containing protein [Cyclobacterium jeungdonense]MDN3687459.1 macro domain-containing protein [Cyclobacterium jeungdonense]